ncbi:translation factor Sua5 [Opitutaceae bacterium TAV5]|nr:translation factor Sua5 [Opitutaceae bacterium TAV5]
MGKKNPSTFIRPIRNRSTGARNKSAGIAPPPPAHTRIYRPTETNLKNLAGVLARGGLVAVPSETVYGLAADALDSQACEAIFKAKGRPHNDPLIVHIASLRQLHQVAEPSSAALALAKAFWPGPLTLVLPKRPAVPDIVTAGLPSVAVRMPAHPVFRKLIRLSGRPLAAPSANPFGYISPTTAQHVKQGLNGRIAHIIDGGTCEVGVESTIIDLRNPDRPTLLRAGGLPAEHISRILNRKIRSAAIRSPQPEPGTDTRNHAAKIPLTEATAAQSAPGMLARHYSPRTPIRLYRRITSAILDTLPENEAVLFLRRPSVATRTPDSGSKNVFWCSESGDLEEIARQLFNRLRSLDNGRWRCIHVDLPRQKKGLAPAIIDRLTRAAAKH